MKDLTPTLSAPSAPADGGLPGIATIDDLESALAGLGARPAHVRRILSAWLGRSPWPDAADQAGATSGRQARLPKALAERLPLLRERLDAVARIRSRHPGADSESERLLITLADGQTIESVLLPRRGVCVSTQMGCAVGCVFCMTGRGRLVRQLTDLEIVAQAALARRLRPETKKVVLMGMGEPSHNLANVLRATALLAEFGGFGHKDLVISTVGDPRLFEGLHAAKARPALAVSLHTIDDAKRRELLPRGCRMPVAELMEAANGWARLSGYPVQYEWTLIEGVNDSPEEIARLAGMLAGRYAMVNFIPVNAVEGSPWRRPSREHCASLVRVLRDAGVIATLRDSAAQDVDGGCGQLRARVLSSEARERQEMRERRLACRTIGEDGK